MKRRDKIRLIILGSLIGLCVFFYFIFPNAESFWHKVYSFFGMGEISFSADDTPFSMHVLDVGDGDAILILCENETLLIDGGYFDEGTTVCRYLQKRNIQTLDWVVSTHADSDHMDGLREVLKKFSIRTFVTSPYRWDINGNMEPFLQENDVLHVYMQAGDHFTVGTAQVSVLGPRREMQTENNCSLVLKVTYGETAFLLMGDAEIEEEMDIFSYGETISCDVLKVGHHGSKTSSTQKFLDRASPQIAVISVGKSYDLPNKDVLKRLEKTAKEIYRTDLHGTVLFLSDGHTIQTKTEK